MTEVRSAVFRALVPAVAMLSAVACASLSPTSQAGDTLVSYDAQSRSLEVSDVGQSVLARIQNLRTPSVVAFNGQSGVLCGAIGDLVFRTDFNAGTIRVVDRIPGGRTTRHMLVDGSGACVYPSGPNISIASGEGVARELELPAGFDLQHLALNGPSNRIGVIGKSAFAVVGVADGQRKVEGIQVRGELDGLSPVALGCCAAFSPDARTLYAPADLRDGSGSVRPGLVAVAAETGVLERIIVPTGEPGLAIATTLGDSPVFISPDGQTLFLTGFFPKGADSGVSSLASIDLDTGTSAEISTGYAIQAVTASGKYLVGRVEGKDFLLDATSGEVIGPVAGWRAVGHGRAAADRFRSVIHSTGDLLAAQEHSPAAPAALAILRSTRTIAEFRVVSSHRQTVVDALRQRREAGMTLPFTLPDEAIADADEQGWARYKARCRAWAEDQPALGRAEDEQLCLLASLTAG